jgi:hypothetical protein
MNVSFKGWPGAGALSLALLAGGAAAGASGVAGGSPDVVAARVQAPPVCKKIVLMGEVRAGHEWKAPFGEGWVFRVVSIPVDKTAPGVDGWDLVVDRDRGAGYPDALLLASPPYHFINEREIGTSFGLRAQDAIGWNPRKFHFMTSRSAFREAHKLYLELNHNGAFRTKSGSDPVGRKEKARKRKMQRFLKLTKQSSPGDFQILDAHLTPGEGKVKPYAVNWDRQSALTPHTDEPPASGKNTPLGELEWMRFSVTLWLPQAWRVPRGLQAAEGTCPE